MTRTSEPQSSVDTIDVSDDDIVDADATLEMSVLELIRRFPEVAKHFAEMENQP